MIASHGTGEARCGDAQARGTQRRTIPVIRGGHPPHQVVYEQLVFALTRAPNVTILTGAGISTSAGIPDFRSPDGLYNRGLPGYSSEVLGPDMFNVRTLQNAQKLVAFGKSMGALRTYSRSAKPTVCHDYIASLHQAGCLLRCYTQNVDGLQTRDYKSLEDVVLELHGNIQKLQCSRCSQPPEGRAEEIDRDLMENGYSYCTKCQERGDKPDPSRKWNFRRLPPGALLPQVLLNEQSVEVQFNGMTMDELERVDGSAALFLVIGTSIRTDGATKLVKSLARKVHQNGGTVVYIDRSKLQDSKWGDYFDVHIQAEIDDWAHDSATCLRKAASRMDTTTELSQAVQALLPQAREHSSKRDRSPIQSKGRQESPHVRQPSTESAALCAPQEREMIVLVCHSGAAPTLARAMANEILELGRSSGWVCRGYSVVLSGSTDNLQQICMSHNFFLVVVHLADYMLRVRSRWRSVEAGQTIPELLEKSVSAIRTLSERSTSRLLIMLCAEDDLLDPDRMGYLHKAFEK
ncbi:hypothetical protein FRC11_000303 [Ceratobasidium sp. 423]|nr:hypothetical protein FRC11_000303 [Ceratobasidium sp. 423]